MNIRQKEPRSTSRLLFPVEREKFTIVAVAVIVSEGTDVADSRL